MSCVHAWLQACCSPRPKGRKKKEEEESPNTLLFSPANFLVLRSTPTDEVKIKKYKKKDPPPHLQLQLPFERVSEHYWAYSFFNLYLVVNNKQPGRSSINQGWVAVSLQFTTTASGATTTIAARLRRLVPHPATARPSIPCLVFPAPACTNRQPAFVAPSTSIGKLRLPNRLSFTSLPLPLAGDARAQVSFDRTSEESDCPPAMAMPMAVAKRCMNPACGAPATGAGGDWRKGWPLRSGAFALLCDKCGYGLLSVCPLLCFSSYPTYPPSASRLSNGEDA